MDSKSQVLAAREGEVDAVLAEFEGDARSAIAALLSDIDTLARDRVAVASFGYTRGNLKYFARQHTLGRGTVDGDYLVEVWDKSGKRIAICAHCDSVTVGKAAFDATVGRYPQNEVTLRQMSRIIERREAPEAILPTTSLVQKV